MSREQVIPQLLNVFRQYGYAGASLAKLSAATGLGKASLYHYFPNGKAEMAAAVLDYLNHQLNEKLLAPLRSDRTPIECVHALSQKIDEFYQHGEQACLLALLSSGEAQDLFQEQIEQTLQQWIESLAQVAIKAGVEPNSAQQRAEDAVLQIQGALMLSRGLKNVAPFERVLHRLSDTLLKP